MIEIKQLPRRPWWAVWKPRYTFMATCDTCGLILAGPYPTKEAILVAMIAFHLRVRLAQARR